MTDTHDRWRRVRFGKQGGDMKFKQVRRWVFAFVLAIAFGLPAQAQESRLDVVVKRDKLIVATYSTAPPLAFTDEKGQLVGFEIDLARLIAKDLLGDPNKIEFMIVQSEGRFPSVLSGRANFAIAATTIYPERGPRWPSPRPIWTAVWL